MDDEIKAASGVLYHWFVELQLAGFTEAQALQLVAALLLK